MILIAASFIFCVIFWACLFGYFIFHDMWHIPQVVALFMPAVIFYVIASVWIWLTQ